MENELDWNRIEDTALALMYLTLHDGNRVWKQIREPLNESARSEQRETTDSGMKHWAALKKEPS